MMDVIFSGMLMAVLIAVNAVKDKTWRLAGEAIIALSCLAYGIHIGHLAHLAGR